MRFPWEPISEDPQQIMPESERMLPPGIVSDVSKIFGKSKEAYERITEKIRRGLESLPGGKPLLTATDFIGKMVETPGVELAIPPFASIKAFHGSPYKFSKFSSKKIGTGEGAQVFGHGHYLTESPEVAKKYARDLQRVKKAEAITEKHYTGKGRPEELEEYIYETTIHKGKKPSEYMFLEWDKPIPQNIRKKILNQAKKENFPTYLEDSLGNRVDIEKDIITGRELYGWLKSPQEASQFLNRAGISGIKYPTGSLSGMKTKEYNYVVFNPEDITIESILPPGIEK